MVVIAEKLPYEIVDFASLPGVPWLRVESDATATQVLFRATYAAFPIGTLLVIVGVLFR